MDEYFVWQDNVAGMKNLLLIVEPESSLRNFWFRIGYYNDNVRQDHIESH